MQTYSGVTTIASGASLSVVGLAGNGNVQNDGLLTFAPAVGTTYGGFIFGGYDGPRE